MIKEKLTAITAYGIYRQRRRGGLIQKKHIEIQLKTPTIPSIYVPGIKEKKIVIFSVLPILFNRKTK
jgi:hypothetical protein